MANSITLSRHKKYVPDLVALNSLCERNFMLLERLVDSWEIAGHINQFETSPSFVFQIKVLELSRYTNLLEIRQLSTSLPDFLQPKVQVRVYHDAKMAEVIKSQNISRIQPSYIYPNKQMHQPDEKHQINLFLHDWLVFCKEQGMSLPSQVAGLN
ncbi:DUF1249 domain-containing protein [Catenovulum sp. 2E275]|uniref:DUF1249 domain-containing protein n=1 Tax=Catenovulum sp. 2E275 TaxID=2980497 RepID=UPI0021D2F84A|nr:DUF1249 domain-containing protein [Catenovulum sp. 2E275]MCU4675325.1 DUF1249 domain-containing protein [Catenovulum sp. 2E275]